MGIFALVGPGHTVRSLCAIAVCSLKADLPALLSQALIRRCVDEVRRYPACRSLHRPSTQINSHTPGPGNAGQADVAHKCAPVQNRCGPGHAGQADVAHECDAYPLLRRPLLPMLSQHATNMYMRAHVHDGPEVAAVLTFHRMKSHMQTWPCCHERKGLDSQHNLDDGAMAPPVWLVGSTTGKSIEYKYSSRSMPIHRLIVAPRR